MVAWAPMAMAAAGALAKSSKDDSTASNAELQEMMGNIGSAVNEQGMSFASEYDRARQSFAGSPSAPQPPPQPVGAGGYPAAQGVPQGAPGNNVPMGTQTAPYAQRAAAAGIAPQPGLVTQGQYDPRLMAAMGGHY